jgi:hypothetical protein
MTREIIGEGEIRCHYAPRQHASRGWDPLRSMSGSIWQGLLRKQLPTPHYDKLDEHSKKVVGWVCHINEMLEERFMHFAINDDALSVINHRRGRVEALAKKPKLLAYATALYDAAQRGEYTPPNWQDERQERSFARLSGR